MGSSSSSRRRRRRDRRRCVVVVVVVHRNRNKLNVFLVKCCPLPKSPEYYVETKKIAFVVKISRPPPPVSYLHKKL